MGAARYFFEGVFYVSKCIRKRSKGITRIKFQVAEVFVEGYLAMLDVRLEMDCEF
ncbi:hypothetical protein ARC272_06910 [Pantoea ananatis]|nr:hypothetical protein ARC272_06910 [Pantoea ananatis]